MADLIVDFPSRARRDASSESSRRATSKSVSFSPEMTIQFYRGPTKAEDDKVRYTSDEYRKFKTDTRSAVRSIHRQYLALAAETGDADAFKGCDLTGLENLLTPELMAGRRQRGSGPTSVRCSASRNGRRTRRPRMRTASRSWRGPARGRRGRGRWPSG